MINGMVSSMPAIERSPLLRNGRTDNGSSQYEEFRHSPLTSGRSPFSGSNTVKIAEKEDKDVDATLFQGIVETIVERINQISAHFSISEADAFKELFFNRGEENEIIQNTQASLEEPQEFTMAQSLPLLALMLLREQNKFHQV